MKKHIYQNINVLFFLIAVATTAACVMLPIWAISKHTVPDPVSWGIWEWAGLVIAEIVLINAAFLLWPAWIKFSDKVTDME
jgi:hypothetical protein